MDVSKLKREREKKKRITNAILVFIDLWCMRNSDNARHSMKRRGERCSCQCICNIYSNAVWNK